MTGSSPFLTAFLTLRVFFGAVSSISIPCTTISIFLRNKTRTKYTYLSNLLLDLLLNLLLLNVVTALDVQDTEKVDASLELANHEIALSVWLDTLDRELSNERRDGSWEGGWIRVLGLEIKWLLAVESEDLCRWDGIALGEDSESGILIWDILGLLPSKLNWVWDDIVDGKVTDAESGGEDGTGEGATTGNGLILVKSEGQWLVEEGGDGLLDGWNTDGSTNQLDGIDFLNGELSIIESLLEWDGYAGKEILGQLLKFLTLEHGGDIDIWHDVLNVERSLGVGGQDLLELLNTDSETGVSLEVGVDINVVLLLELLGKVVDEDLVERTSTKVSVISGTQNLELTLLERNDGASVVGVTDIDESNSSWLLVWEWEISLCDSVAEGSSGGVVDESEELETGDIRSIDHGASLLVGEPVWHGNDNIGDWGLELSSGGGFYLGQEHSNKLCGRELFLLSKISDLSTNLTVDLQQVGGDELLLNVELWVVEVSSYYSLEARDCVLEVRDLLGLCWLSEISGLWAETDNGTVNNMLAFLLHRKVVEQKSKRSCDKEKWGTYGVFLLETSLTI